MSPKPTERRLLDDVMIAAPCNVGWESMHGDDRVRFCDKCELNVYNISAMSDREAEELLQINGSKVCLRLYRRADGTIITDNCPVGLRALRDKLVKAKERDNMLVKVAAAAALLLLGLPANADGKKTHKPKAGAQCKTTKAPADDDWHPPTMGLPPPPTINDMQPVEANGDADTTAFKYYTEAVKNQRNGNLMVAEINYKKALEAVPKDKHDPKFRAKIRKEYAQFLKDQHRDKEAQELPE